VENAVLENAILQGMLCSGMLCHGDCNTSVEGRMLRRVECLHVEPIYKGLVIILYE